MVHDHQLQLIRVLGLIDLIGDQDPIPSIGLFDLFESAPFGTSGLQNGSTTAAQRRDIAFPVEE
jgi:hypothetical protein